LINSCPKLSNVLVSFNQPGLAYEFIEKRSSFDTFHKNGDSKSRVPGNQLARKG
jgi:hypothetical protein